MTLIHLALDLALRTFGERHPSDTFAYTVDARRINITRNGGHFLTSFFPSIFLTTLETRYGQKAPGILASFIVDSRSEEALDEEAYDDR